MQLDRAPARLAVVHSFAAPMRCPHCGDPMVAPETSEFVAGGEIRHHWQCDNCGRTSSTSFRAAPKKAAQRRNR